MAVTDALRHEHRDLEPLIQACADTQSHELAEVQRAARALQAALARYLTREAPLLQALERSIAAQRGPLAVLRLERSELTETLRRLDGVDNAETARWLLHYAAAVAGTLFDDEENELFPIADSFLEHESQTEPLWQPLESETLQIA
jgi:septal ring factor EnvC (AmiA/AmiB activator)